MTATMTAAELTARPHQLDSTKTAALTPDGKCYEWNPATQRWELQASRFIRSTVAKPSTHRNRKEETVDVIVVEPNGHGIGWPSFECEVGFAHTQHRSHLTLVQFARQHFGHGILRKIGEGRYAVVRTAPSVWGEVFDCPRNAA